LSYLNTNCIDIFSCDVSNPPGNYKHLAEQSYKNYGVFFLKGVFSKSEVKLLRNDSDQLFNENGDKRVRYVRDIQSEVLKHNFSKAFMNKRLLDLLDNIFSDSDVSLLPPFNIARNYLPHSLHTESMGWHRDCNGEEPIKECRNMLKDQKYVFGKIGLYLQDNSEYGGAIDIVPGSNRDFLKFPIGWSKATFWIKFFVFIQRYTPFIYKRIVHTKIVASLIGTRTTDVGAGDVVIFDSRIFHKGTPAHKDIEKNLIYHHDSLQAELPKDYTKYVFYSHFGNSIGIKSYFLDRLSRDTGDTLDKWIEDANAVEGALDSTHTFFRKKESLIDDSFKALFI
jgi:hypothetical protein